MRAEAMMENFILTGLERWIGPFGIVERVS